MISEFQGYLRIDTRQPSPQYAVAVSYLRKVCEGAGASEIIIKEYVKGKPILIATFSGHDSALGALLLNSHMDVVPTVDSKWSFPPISATVHDGKIFARGSQDMKCVGMAYLHALQVVVKNLRRTVHVSFVPDEEIGGQDGMGLLVKDAELMKKLNVEAAMDEGLPSPFDNYLLFTQERSKLWLRLHIPGPAGHGSMLAVGTAAEKLTYALSFLDDLRKGQIQRLSNEQGRLGRVSSLNVTMIQSSSTQVNVIPSEFTVDIDVRVGPDFESEQALIDRIAAAVGEFGCTLEIKERMNNMRDISHHKELENALAGLFPLMRDVFPGGTDARYLRQLGIPALGISLFRGVPTLLHDHDEYITIAAYEEGVANYVKLLKAFCC